MLDDRHCQAIGKAAEERKSSRLEPCVAGDKNRVFGGRDETGNFRYGRGIRIGKRRDCEATWVLVRSIVDP
jgi:hypothetical protein